MILLLLPAGAALLRACRANTRTWSAIRLRRFRERQSQGPLAPQRRPALARLRDRTSLDSSTAYLWTLARDSHGNLYAGGGPGAKLFRMNPNGGGEQDRRFRCAGDPRHRDRFERSRVCRHLARRQGLSDRIRRHGKSEVFYDPKQKYIWAMALRPERRPVHRYGRPGRDPSRHARTAKARSFSRAKRPMRARWRSIAKGNLIVGHRTWRPGLRIASQGRRIRALPDAQARSDRARHRSEDEIYAAAVGSKTASLPIAPLHPHAARGQRVLPGSSRCRVAAPAAAPVVAPLNIPGGSDVYLISPQRSPERLWTGAQDVAYSLALDSDGHLLIGSGNKGICTASKRARFI